MATEKRLIDRNEIFPNGTFFANAEDPLKSLDELIKRIWSIPTVDAVEVVHGRWEDVYGGKYQNKRYRCSVCKEKALFRFKQDELISWHEEQKMSNYCPNCGADMRERKDNDKKDLPVSE